MSQVLDEINHSPTDQVYFTDDNIIGRPAYTRESFKALPAKKIRWYTQLSSNIVHRPDLIELAARAVCYSAFPGIESINENVSR